MYHMDYKGYISEVLDVCDVKLTDSMLPIYGIDIKIRVQIWSIFGL